MALETPCYGQTRQGMACPPPPEREKASKGFGLQQPQESRGRIKAKATAFSQHRDGKAEKFHETRFPWAQVTHRNSFRHRQWKTVGETYPSLCQEQPSHPGQTDPVSIPGLYCGPQ